MKAPLLALAAVGLGGLGLAAGLALEFRSDVHRAEQKVAGASRVVATSFGPMEYAVAGKGPRLLMIHGTGGGFDQGLIFTEKLVQHGVQVVAPSRFGYLRSSFPSDPSSERQADALVELLDDLKIDKIAVAGGSAGALSAAQFAIRHPDRCTALILVVPAANVRGTDPVVMGPLQAFAVRKVTTSNFLFWMGLKTMRRQMIGTLLATDPRRVAEASPREKRRVQRILDAIMPVEHRWRGMLNDARLAGHPARMDFARVKAPTLVISVEDDRFGTAATAQDIAAATPGSKLILYPAGGHVWVGHDDELWTAVARFLAATQSTKGTVSSNSTP